MANRDSAMIVAQHRIEQHLGPNIELRDMAFWPEDWVLSLKYHLRQPALV